jgi:dihydrofolate reductase
MKEHIKFIKMRQLISFMHVSLDGFVAGVNGEMDWIKVDPEMFELAGKQTDRSDTALYGRVTYEMMDSYWPTAAAKPQATSHDIKHSHWYNSVHKVVVSRSWEGRKLNHATIIGNNLEDEVLQLKQREGREIIMFGSPSTVHSLLRSDLIDEFWIFINPILLGQGIPLFKNISKKLPLTLISSRVFSSGVVSLHYEKLAEGI